MGKRSPFSQWGRLSSNGMLCQGIISVNPVGKETNLAVYHKSLSSAATFFLQRPKKKLLVQYIPQKAFTVLKRLVFILANVALNLWDYYMKNNTFSIITEV